MLGGGESGRMISTFLVSSEETVFYIETICPQVYVSICLFMTNVTCNLHYMQPLARRPSLYEALWREELSKKLVQYLEEKYLSLKVINEISAYISRNDWKHQLIWKQKKKCEEKKYSILAKMERNKQACLNEKRRGHRNSVASWRKWQRRRAAETLYAILEEEQSWKKYHIRENELWKYYIQVAGRNPLSRIEGKKRRKRREEEEAAEELEEEKVTKRNQ